MIKSGNKYGNTLKFQKVRSLFIHIRSLSFQHLVQTLTLQTASSHGEVHKCHTTAQVWSKFHLEFNKKIVDQLKQNNGTEIVFN